LALRTIISVVGARPNFMKLAPVARTFATRDDVRHVVVHTGQHYDFDMSDAFFRDLEIVAPDYNLGVGSASHAQQTALIMQRFEPVCEAIQPDLVLVYGDVNSTVATALVAAKLGLKVGHVEAGLRSGDWTMPEEINRVVTDRLADLLFTPSRDGNDNLDREGVPRDRVHFVGNVMIDSLVHALPSAVALDAPRRRGLAGAAYCVVTLHRPSNVDVPDRLATLVDALADLSRNLPVLFMVHPRTRARLGEPRAVSTAGDLRLADPVGYLEMLSLVRSASIVVTDSGGLQEETSYLGVPCITVRANTERPVTVKHGTNRLVAPTKEDVLSAASDALSNGQPKRPPIERWDGQAATRIASVIFEGSRFS
jgi:UDP-N-acetylglucosamine 2-epimerase (non-hydrolysing)